MPITLSLCDNIYSIPTVDELTIADLLALRRIDYNKPVDVLRWGLGCEPVLHTSKLTEHQLGNVLRLIDALFNDVVTWMESDARLVVPKTLDVLGLQVKFSPGLVNQLPYWGTVRCRNAMEQEHAKQADKAGVDYTDRIPEILAHYLYSMVTRNAYDEDKADDFISVTQTLNFKIAIQAGNFFLLKQIPRYQTKRDCLATRLTVMSKKLRLRFSQSLRT